VGATATDDGGRWLATWGASPQVAIPPSVLPIPGDVSAAGFTNQTVRNIIFTSVGGSALRLRLTNSFGSQPVTFDEVNVGVVESGAALVAGSSQAVRFGGRGSVTIAPGAEALSDPVRIEVGP